MIDWAVATMVHPGEELSGDRHLIAPHETGTLVAVIDALGHGPEAAQAAGVAASVLNAYPQHPLEWLFEQCHEVLLHSRGVAMGVASYRDDATLSWLSVGNVEAVLMTTDEAGRPLHSSLLVRGGVVGFRLPGLRPSSMPLKLGDRMVITTDGVDYHFAGALRAMIPLQTLADNILRDYAKGTDDALVLVTQYRGD